GVDQPRHDLELPVLTPIGGVVDAGVRVLAVAAVVVIGVGAGDEQVRVVLALRDGRLVDAEPALRAEVVELRGAVESAWRKVDLACGGRRGRRDDESAGAGVRWTEPDDSSS